MIIIVIVDVESKRLKGLVHDNYERKEKEEMEYKHSVSYCIEGSTNLIVILSAGRSLSLSLQGGCEIKVNHTM